MTKIDWTDKVWNVVTGCTPIATGCENCYAARMAPRLGGRCGYPADEPFRVTLHEDRLRQPLDWKKPQKVFACSMGDLLHEDVPFEFILKVLMVMDRCTHHTFQLLTKRSIRLLEFCEKHIGGDSGNKWPPNIWAGASASTQDDLDDQWRHLRKVPATVRWLSLEPLLGPIMIPHDIDWLVVGGETGPRARPMNPEWVKEIVSQCSFAGVPLFFKQWGEWLHVGDSIEPGSNVVSAKFERVGKKAAGHLLDSVSYRQFPGDVESGNGISLVR